MAGRERIEHGALPAPKPAPTEASPLLGASDARNSLASSTASATATATSTVVAHDDGPNGPAQDGGAEAARKLHLLLPALAIGIFLSAFDQTLIVATYARMSSDLHALNRTSWISTA